MRKDILGKIGLGAVIILAPGGFILGVTLIANHYRKRAARLDEPATDAARDEPEPERLVA